MLVLIYLACKMVPANKFPQWTWPKGITFWITAILSAIYVVLGGICLLFRLFGVRILFSF